MGEYFLLLLRILCTVMGVKYARGREDTVQSKYSVLYHWNRYCSIITHYRIQQPKE